MNKIIALLLLCPLAAFAAEWNYDGQEAPAGDATSEAASSDAGLSMSAPPASLPAQAPTNNMIMSKVREATGEPEIVMAAVGEPPITRWQYPGYVVYFEHDRDRKSVV